MPIPMSATRIRLGVGLWSVFTGLVLVIVSGVFFILVPVAAVGLTQEGEFFYTLMVIMYLIGAFLSIVGLITALIEQAIAYAAS